MEGINCFVSVITDFFASFFVYLYLCKEKKKQAQSVARMALKLLVHMQQCLSPEQ